MQIIQPSLTRSVGWACWLGGLLLHATFCGCGQRLPTYRVSGVVQFSDGRPVRSGTVELESVAHGTAATGTIQRDGTFVLGTYRAADGAVAGEHRAIVVQLIVNDGSIQHTTDHGGRVPPRYGDYASSPLKVIVLPQAANEVSLIIDNQP